MAKGRSKGPGAAGTLLGDLRRQVEELKDDLRARLAGGPEAGSTVPEDREALREARERLAADYAEARRHGRTTGTEPEWQEAFLDQAAVAWVLTCVFVRFLEDQGFVEEPFLAGAASAPEGRQSRLERAQERQHAWFQRHPRHTEREYLQAVFGDLAALPGCGQLFGPEHNPAWLLAPSGDGARALVRFFAAEETDRQALRRPFGPLGGEWAGGGDTRFLGDLYQDLSGEARERYALLQTPDFVEEFLLDRTLEPALRDFGLRQARLLDPTCGSGHFLLGGFRRLFARWSALEPDAPPAALAQRALDGVTGVDLNPFAAAIARFRLWVEALRASGTTRLQDAPNFTVHVACGDSLLYARRHGSGTEHLLDLETGVELADWLPETAARGDFVAASRLLQGRYHAVVGNPPYIVDRDPDHNRAVRARYPRSAYRQYSLAVPFTERFFELAVPSGYVGLITANSFMKREFGKKVIQDVLPGLDLTHVLDTSGAYIPGHGTPTVILLGRARRPSGDVVRAVLSIRGEPSTPADPARGLVWRSVVDLVDQPGQRTDFVSVADVPRATFARHPWSLGGGGASELKEAIEAAAPRRLGEICESIGFHCITKADEIFAIEAEHVARLRLNSDQMRTFGIGEQVRDWSVSSGILVIFPYDEVVRTLPLERLRDAARFLWPYRTELGNRKLFGGKNYFEGGKPWWEYGQIPPDKLRTPLSLAFAEIATHNHFVLDRGGRIFNRTAPVIKLPAGATEDEHLALLGLLNSSVACFWLKQVCHNKGATSDRGVLQADPERFRFVFDGTKLRQFPIPKVAGPQRDRLISLARSLDAAGAELGGFSFQDFVDELLRSRTELKQAFQEKFAERDALRMQMARWQEELDWLCYELYGLIPGTSPARSRIHSSTPDKMPGLDRDARPYRLLESASEGTSTDLDSYRIQEIQSNSWLRLLEVPDYKRRWQRSAGAYDANEVTDGLLLERALRSWLLDRLESPDLWPEPELLSADQLHVRAGRDPGFRQVAALYAGREDVDLAALVRDLALSEAVPYLPRQRYKESGLRKRRQWEETWDLQRREDRGERVGSIPVPPKYTSADFQKGTYWSLRGKLDVPKERFLLYPGAEREADPSPVLGWAGWDHAEQARALARYYLDRRDLDAWEPARLAPLLAGLLELRPWLFQWHDHPDPETGEHVAGSYAGFLDEELRALGLTEERLREA